MKIIDSHIHVWVRQDPRFPMYDPPEQYPWWKGTTEDYLREMDEAGIHKAVIVQIPSHRYDHSYALTARDKYPEVFAVAGLLDLQTTDPAETLFDLKQKQGIQGVRLSPGSRYSLADNSLEPLWTAAGRLRFPSWPRSTRPTTGGLPKWPHAMDRHGLYWIISEGRVC